MSAPLPSIREDEKQDRLNQLESRLQAAARPGGKFPPTRQNIESQPSNHRIQLFWREILNEVSSVKN